MGNWETEEKFVLKAIEENKNNVAKLFEESAQNRTSIAVLQVKAGMWGAGAGVLVTVGTVLLRGL